jgi:hypothetical protein
MKHLKAMSSISKLYVMSPEFSKDFNNPHPTPAFPKFVCVCV